MVQAVFLVPFCPNAKVYADTMRDFIFGQQGPMAYFHQVCDGVMREAWKMGCQGTFTAAFNNMVVRNIPGFGDPIVVQGPGGTIDGLITDLYQNPTSSYYVEAQWYSSSLRGIDRHETFYRATYPADPPELQVLPLEMSYYFWIPQDARYPHYACGTGWGINAPGPVLDMPANYWQLNPLEVINGVKRYDFDLAGVPPGVTVPDLSLMPIGPCPTNVCGVDQDALSYDEGVPEKIIPEAAGTVRMEVLHRVAGNTGTPTPTDPSGGGWRSRFREVEANSTAEYGAPPVVTEPWTWPQNQQAQVSLTHTN
ncbi:MAG: hypothetical protein HYT88_04515 [Candidatus Omnitrophica bacterium]|nr:hypothetical protein [Candidatus Omnitrophota bacterium]